MTEPLLISRQRTALQDLYQLIADRARREPLIDQEFQARSQAAEKEFQDTTHQIITRFETEKESSQTEFQETQDKVAKRFARERAGQDKELKETQQRVNSQFEAESSSLKADYQKRRSQLAKELEGNKAKADFQLNEAEDKVNEAIKQSKQMEREVKGLLKEWRQDHDFGPLPPAGQPDRVFKDAFRQVQEGLETAQAQSNQIKELRLPGLFKGKGIVILLLVLIGSAAGLGIALGGLMGGGIGGGIGLLVGAVLALVLFNKAKGQIVTIFNPFRQALVDLEGACDRARAQTQEAYKKRMEGAQKAHDKEVSRITEKYQSKRDAVTERRDSELKQAEEKYQKAVADSTQRRDADLRSAHEKYQKLRNEIFQRYETDSHQVHERHYKAMTESRLKKDSEWNVLVESWQKGLTQVHAVVEEVNRENASLFPPWSSPAWNNWTAPKSIPPVLRFGDYQVNLAELPNGLSKDERLKPTIPNPFSFPALLSFPRRCSMLLKTSEESRTAGVQALQALMLRYLTSLPPGKVRFTIIDPVGLGENFGAFMHLADYDEALVNSRIWTELSHIEQRLSDLTGHMENVLQKYLRNEYETIEEYNEQAGEVAEPYRILVVANFPSNFSAEAARRLVSIVSSGARCGVYGLITADISQDMPQGFSLATLEQTAVNLEWQGQKFIWKDPDFEKFALQMEMPPPAEFCSRILHHVGQKAREANRVEVPFDFIAPAKEQWWVNDSRSGVNVALGRAGVTKRQHLELGKGTSQHVLIAGKTGSGKSTLLHALITNLSLLYSPDEIELYLIDFKKGVEFKTYAAHELPHARVVAIESDREFGLSVLQRLDAELRLRGEKFRQVGAQDLKSYREANGSQPLPRILLIVDEFQEFFTEDDKVAQDAAQLMDRIVRQGRAFGLHVLLGSQTLGGAYSLARSTIDQMAVRIALQCSEADAHLILSDDNSAARLLSRPGEAIYNDANGLVEGNNPFQVVWLPEPRREQFLDTIREMDRKRNPDVPRPQIVFEGNALADITKNVLLSRLLHEPSWPSSPRAFQAWLGEAMAIKDPTAAVFRRQTGSNLLLVGQQEEAALGILATALVSLAAQHIPADDSNRPVGARFYLMDGTPSDAPNAGYLARLAGYLPHPVQVVTWRDVSTVIGELSEEVSRRQQSNEVEGATLYLIIYGLQRFRDLRREEDDFGSFGQSEEKPSPAKQLAAILREGAGLGVHVLVYCDSLNNVNRAFDRQALRELDMRVLFQMSTTDSSTLIDTPLAGRLGSHRAYFHSEEEGRLEKFRPYGLPPESWLAKFKQFLSRKQAAEPVRQNA